jgi:hypothetical protein
MAVLKAMTSGGERRELDFYPTPPEATRALLPLIDSWPREVWEPCCGAGAISEVLIREGFEVVSSDIEPRGYGRVADFFDIVTVSHPTVITNPPFNEAERFIRHAYEIGVTRMALLLKIDYWNAATRRGLFEEWRPSLFCPLTWRLDFTGAGRPHTNCAWCIWDPRDYRHTRFLPLAKPVGN